MYSTDYLKKLTKYFIKHNKSQIKDERDIKYNKPNFN